MSMTVIERLDDLLKTKDAEIEKLREEIDVLEGRLRTAKDGWLLHRETTDPQALPVPRLEMAFLLHPDGRDECLMEYRLVYQHFLGHYVIVPLGSTRRSGGRARDPFYDGKLDLPFRDGAHILHDAATLNLPAFAVFGDHVETIEPSQRKTA